MKAPFIFHALLVEMLQFGDVSGVEKWVKFIDVSVAISKALRGRRKTLFKALE